MRTRRVLFAVAAILATVIASAGTALAYWSSGGAGSGAATVGTLNAPTAAQATTSAGTGTVTVTWTASAVASNAPAPNGYYVVRYDSSGQPAPACGSDSAHLIIPSTACNDTLVPVGTYTYVVVAVFRSWTAASAASAPVTVAKAAQVITFTSTPPSSASYQGTVYTVTASGGGSSNPVTFTIDSSAAAVCSISGAVVSFIGTGTCVIDANQAGSTYYDAASQEQQSFAVAKAAQSITFTSTAPSDAVVGGVGYSPAATGGGSGSAVVFTIDSTTAATCSINNGFVTYQHAGSCTVDANQAGSANFAAANQVQQSFAVGPGAQAITFTSTPSNPTVNGPAYIVSATGGGSGNPVTFTVDAVASGVCAISGTTVSFLSGGTCVIDANQAGNSDYLAAAQVQQQFVVAKADQAISFSSTAPANAVVAGPTYTAEASASSGLTVTFSSGSPSVCTSGGTDGATFTFVATGTCIVNADQAGNASYNAAPRVQQPFQVSPAINGSGLCFAPNAQSACLTSPVVIANGGTFTAVVRLLDATGKAVNANSAITVSLSHVTGDDLSTPSPASVIIQAGASVSGSFSTTLTSSGNGKHGTITATAGSLSVSIVIQTAK